MQYHISMQYLHCCCQVAALLFLLFPALLFCALSTKYARTHSVNLQFRLFEIHVCAFESLALHLDLEPQAGSTKQQQRGMVDYCAVATKTSQQQSVPVLP